MKHNPIGKDSVLRVANSTRFDFSELAEPRQQNLIKFSMGALLSLVISGFAAQQTTLRMIERFYWYLRRPAQRHLGFGTKRAPCDTTIYNLLVRLDPAGLRHTLVQHVKRAIKRKEVTNDLFPGGIAAIDGKGGIEDWGFVRLTRFHGQVSVWLRPQPAAFSHTTPAIRSRSPSVGAMDCTSPRCSQRPLYARQPAS